MVFKKMAIIFLFLNLLFLANAQKKQIMIADYEHKPNTDSWWKYNAQVKFLYDENSENQVNKKSKVCLHVRWDSIPENLPFVWFTDLKADTFAAQGMQKKWKSFKEKTWLSFWCKAGSGDSLMLHYLVLSKGHKSKWGAKKMIPFTSQKWTFVKVKFADLQYENWGVTKAELNLKSEDVICFEVGLRLSSTSPKGFIDVWFDNLKLSNYEPFE